MAWSTPIIDRTQADVDYIKSIIERIRLIGYTNLTAQEKNDWESATLKGTLNVGDLQRIEDNISYLSTTLTSYGFNVPIVTGSAWTVNSIGYVDDLDRIKNNIISLVNGFYNDLNNPTITTGSRAMNFTIANQLEQVIYNTRVLLDNMILSFKPCGTFNCGATIFL
jgi:hypothetical protein